MKRNLIGFALVLAALCAQIAAWPAQATHLARTGAQPAQPFALVKDSNTTPQPQSSMFLDTIFAVVNNTLLFSAHTPQAGGELWASDGTPDGTRLVKDINPGEETALNVQSNLSLVLNDRLLFTVDDGAHGLELWAGRAHADARRVGGATDLARCGRRTG